MATREKACVLFSDGDIPKTVCSIRAEALPWTVDAFNLTPTSVYPNSLNPDDLCLETSPRSSVHHSLHPGTTNTVTLGNRIARLCRDSI